MEIVVSIISLLHYVEISLCFVLSTQSFVANLLSVDWISTAWGNLFSASPDPMRLLVETLVFWRTSQQRVRIFVHLPILTTANQDMKHPPSIYRSCPRKVWNSHIIHIYILVYPRPICPFPNTPTQKINENQMFLSLQDHPTDYGC